MATVQEPRAGRADAFVGEQIDRARRRIRAQDVGIAALGLIAGTLGYALGMVLLDRWLHLSDVARQIALLGYAAAAAAYVGFILTRPFRREVNPYFAARRVEAAVPGAKNSVISWLDLHDEPLPPSIHSAVSQKAAADLKRADLDEVVRDRRLPWLGGTAGGLFVAALILFFLLRPNQFLSLLSRAFAPFSSGAIASQTEIDLLQPAGGDVTVPVNTPVDFRVVVSGRVPDPSAADAVRLRMRYNPADPVWEEMPLIPSPRDPREFVLRLPAGKVQTGFVYQVVGGDAATPEHRVSVRSSPLIEGWEVVYHFRPYLRFRDQMATKPDLEGLRGTEVTLTARTNRTVRDGQLTFEPVRDGQTLPPPLTAAAVSGEPSALRFKFVLTEDARYTITFHSAEGEQNDGSFRYTIKVLSDHPPQVEVTHPAPDTLPVNGTLQVEGKASDDFGITAMRLCLQLPGEPPTALAPKPYRPEKVFKFADDTYPRALDYKDFLPLEQVKSTIGAAVPLKTGSVIEYWLEAVDNCDAKPNVGKSKVFKVTLAAEQPQDEKRDGEKQAADAKAAHEQKQDQDLDKENEAKRQQGDQGDQGQPDGQPKEGGKPDGQPQGEPKAGEGNTQKDSKDEAVEQQAHDLQRKLDQARRENGKGEAKDKPPPQPGDQSTNPGEQKGEQSDANSQGATPNQPSQPQSEKGEGKGESKSAQPQPNGEKGEGKPDGQPNPQPEPGAAKDSQPKSQPNAQQGGPNQPQPQPKPADQKNNDGGQENSGQPQQGEKQPNPGEAKQSPQEGGQNAGEKKQQPQGDAKPGEGKDRDNQGAGKNDSQPAVAPSTGGQPGGDPQNNKPGQPQASPPKQGAKEPDNRQGATGNRNPAENPQKNPDGNNSPPKLEPGKGGQPGQKDRPGEQTGTGPKKNPLDKDPMGQPDPNDPNRDGKGGKTGSGQAGGTPPKDGKAEGAPHGPGQGGAPDAGEAKSRHTPADAVDKGQGKPAGNDANDQPSGQPGGPSGKGDLKDAPKPHENPGTSTTTKPTTDGTPADGRPSGDDARGQPNGPDRKDATGQPAAAKAQADANRKPDGQGRGEPGKPAGDSKGDEQKRRQAVEEGIKEAIRHGLNSPDPMTRRKAEEFAKELAKRAAKDRPTREALEEAMKSADPATRQAIEQAMKQASQESASGDAQPKPGQPADQQGEPGKGEPRDGPQRPGVPGDGSPSSDQGKPDSRRTGTGVPSDNPQRDPTATPSTPQAGAAPNPEHARKTGDLQLERFPKNPSRDLLQELGMTEEQYRQFLKDAAALQKKRDAEAAHNRERGAGTGASPANTGAKRVQPIGDKKDQLERGGATPPPPEYRDGYRGYTEDVSKPAGGAKKE